MSFITTQTEPSAAYNRLYTTLTASLAGAGKAQLELEIANTFQALCRETGVWREKVTRNAIGGLDTYELSPSTNSAQVVWIVNLEVDEKPYTPLGGATIAADSLYNSYQVGPDYTTVKITPVPGADKPKALKFTLMLAPCDGSLDLPGQIIDQYFESIKDGVLERMMFHGNRPYTNPVQAEIHKKKFHAATTRIRRDVRGGNSNSSPPWRFPGIARGGSRRGARSYGY